MIQKLLLYQTYSFATGEREEKQAKENQKRQKENVKQRQKELETDGVCSDNTQTI